MTKFRLLLMTFGPLAIVAVSMRLSERLRPEFSGPPASNHVVSGQALAGEARPARPRQANADERLVNACRQAAAKLAGRLGPDCSTLVRAPFVVAGDLSAESLEEWHKETIGPAARAMAKRYFRLPPDEPITVLLFSGEAAYNRYAEQLFKDRGVSIYGYYKPQLRTLVMNIGTGGGTLVHELTHALADFDFPRIPDWFNEGLASLHEQCRFRSDAQGPWIEGLENWRLPGLQKAIRAGRLQSLDALATGADFRGAREGLNYAQARYFCLYMQRQGVLEDFYRRFREGIATDPHGTRAIQEVFPRRTWAELDQDFQGWALKLERPLAAAR